MNIFGGGAIIRPTTAEMEGAPRPTMSLSALSSLPQPGEVVLRGCQVQAPCLENGKCLLHHHYQGEMRMKVRLERNSQCRELFRPETLLVNMVEGYSSLCLQHLLLSRTILCSPKQNNYQQTSLGSL